MCENQLCVCYIVGRVAVGAAVNQQSKSLHLTIDSSPADRRHTVLHIHTTGARHTEHGHTQTIIRCNLCDEIKVKHVGE